MYVFNQTTFRCVTSVGAIFLFLLLPTVAQGQFQFRPNQRFNPYQQRPTYQPNYPRQRYQAYPNGMVPGQYQPQVQTPVQRTPQSSVTPASVLRYAIKPSRKGSKFPRLAGEFEPQKAILLSVSDLMYQHHGVLAEIIEKSSGHNVPFVILYNDDKQLGSTIEILDSIGCDLSHVSLHKLKLDTIWLRDFGPRIAEAVDGADSIDFYYNGQRPLDDKFPITWAKVSGAESTKVKWTIQGGNLYSNGKGFAITTSRIFEDNAINFAGGGGKMDVEFERRKIVVDAFKEQCNIDRLLILEPLKPEATKHVDMFATFVAADRIVVAKIDPRVDPYNAKILEYNVNLLKQIKVDGKPLQIDRIEVPPRKGKYWSPYTNVILANNLLLMPVYKSDPPGLVKQALETYRRILPDCHVATVDLTTMQKLEGALHCMSINVPAFADLPPNRLSVDQARLYLKRVGYVAKKKTPPVLVGNPVVDNSTSPNLNRGNEIPNSISLEPPKLVESNPKAEFPKRKPNGSAAGPKGSPPADNTGRNSTTGNARASQMAAAMTYRRTFVDASRTFSLDAFAIGFQSGQLVLLRSGEDRVSMIRIERLCNEDKNWLSKNADKIRQNGEKVRQFVLSNRL